jgi:hypothetical protein
MISVLHRAPRHLIILLALLSAVSAINRAQTAAPRIPLTVTDESGLPVSGAEVTLTEASRAPVQFWTDYAGRCELILHQTTPFQLHIAKSGYYAVQMDDIDPRQPSLQAALTREHLLQQQVQVTATPPGIDTQQTSDKFSMNTPEIVNVPYPTSRDIRNLLPFVPGVVADGTGQVHVAGSETWQTLDTLDDFDIRSPASGLLAMRVSADAVRSIDIQSTRYPVEFGRSTGGVIAFYTGTGDNKFRFNATNFIPSIKDQNGIRFDKFVPRFTFSGPIVRDHAWFFDGLEVEYDDIYISELPANADTNHLIRGSNLLKLQANASSTNSVTGGLLYNGYHSPYDGLSPLVPQQSTTKRDTTAWLPFVRDQQRLSNGGLLDAGVGVTIFHDGYEPHGDIPFELTPETAKGSFFENLTGTSQRTEGNAALYFPEQQWKGSHDVRAGIDLDHISFGETVFRMPVNYLREDGTLLRQSVFPVTPQFTRHNVETGAYIEDHWNTSLLNGLLIEPGLRFDWDEIVRRPLFSPRIAVVYAPGTHPNTKVSAGIGLYYDHTQLQYLEEALAGIRYDTYYGPDGITPESPPLLTTFIYDQSALREARALNWSIALEQKLPGSIYAAVNFLDKRVSNVFTYANQSGPSALYGNYLLTNTRQDHDYAAEIEARHTFAQGYTLFASYTYSSAHTNAAINYVPTISPLGPQQSGPLPWNTPNRVLSWGWLPLELPKLKNSWDFVYTFQWQNGFPITSVDANQQVIGAVGSHTFPNFLSFSPGLEWRFHFHGYYFGLRGVAENITNSQNPAIVNNNVSSPDYLVFSESLGRAFTTRIRLIQSKQ